MVFKFLIFSTILTLLTVVYAEEKPFGTPRKCKGADLKFPASMKQSLKDCREKIWPNSTATDDENKILSKQEKKERFASYKPKLGCLMICKAKGMDLIDDNGKLNKEKHSEFIGQVVQDKEVASKLSSEVQNRCFDSHADLVFSDETCERDNGEFITLVECIHKTAKEVCGLPVE